MHRAEPRLTSWVAMKSKSALCDQLDNTIATTASKDLKLDTADYSYSGLVSLCESISSFKRDGFTWGTVKSYYATFYLLRAYLASKNIAIFFREHDYWYVECIDSARIFRTAKSTHSAVIEVLKKQSFARNILQEDAGLTIVDKLRQLREEANYGQSPLSDPLPLLDIKSWSESFDASRVLASYGRDPTIYAYTDGHALLAFPIFVWTKVREEMKEIGTPIVFSDVQKKYLSKYLEQFKCKAAFEKSLFNLD